MANLTEIAAALDHYFAISELHQDPSFSRFIPQAYAEIGVDWRPLFETDFISRFNGLMIRGAENVRAIFLASFPSQAVLQEVLSRGARGDLLFTHHPLDIRCGDPRGKWGQGVLAMPPKTIAALREGGLSLYAVHAPLDYHRQISTSRALMRILNGSVAGEFMPFGNGNAGIIGDIPPISIEELIQKYQTALNLSYVDLAGPMRQRIERIAVVAGCGDHLPSIQQMEADGIHAYITGEIRTRIEGEYGREKYKKITTFAETSSMSLIGLSHAASEFAVMADMANWFQARFAINTVLLPEAIWWRYAGICLDPDNA